MAARLAITVALAATLTEATDNCFWRSDNQIRAMGNGWFACNNTQINEGGAQLCCIQGSQCGQDSICLQDTKYYVGGCTDGSYGDGVCRTSCTSDSATWIQWNNNTQTWECCGKGGCNGSNPTETFSAVARASWSPVQTAPQSSSTPADSQTSTGTSESAITTSTSGTESSDTTEEQTSSGLSTGAQAGIGVACGLVGLGAILVLALLLIRRHKKRKTIEVWPHYDDTKGLAPSSGGPDTFSESASHAPPGSIYPQQPPELMSQAKTEMPAETVPRAELESDLTRTTK